MIVIDMKNPETCADCPIINGEYGICEILDREVWGIPPKDCPIVGEIPDKHGRLIDLDAYLKASENMAEWEEYRVEEIEEYFETCPVILEASK